MHNGRTTQHTHVTRDIKPPGQCPACDETWAAARRNLERRNGVDRRPS